VPYVAYAAPPTGSKLKVTRLALRSHYWGALVVVVAAGDLDVDGGARLASYLRRVQLENDVVVDLLDVTSCDPEGVATLEAAKERADATGWGFALVADPEGPCVQALEASAAAATIPTYADRHIARAALQN
jgi:anti-anti-sigma regulatory factor